MRESGEVFVGCCERCGRDGQRVIRAFEGVVCVGGCPEGAGGGEGG